MSIFLFILYLFFFGWLVTRIPFFRASGLKPLWITGIFILKVGAACLYGYIHAQQPDHLLRMDTWRFFAESLPEYEALHRDPLRFFREIFIDPYDGGIEKIFSTRNSYWNDLKNNFMIKLTAVLDVFSGRNYYVNLIFYNFLGLFGPVALYRACREALEEDTLPALLACFFVPSVVFWTSGYHKEGLLYSAMGIYTWQLGRLMRSGWRIAGFFVCACCLGLVFILRNIILFALLPATIGWIWSEGFRWHTRLQYGIVISICLLVFFTSSRFIPRLDLPLSVSLRQSEFIRLGGNTALPVDPLEPTFRGFVKNLPSALDIGLFRPYPGQAGAFYIPFSLEVVIFCCLLLLAILLPSRAARGRPMMLYFLSAGMILVLIIGYTVPNVGAVIRYRSLAIPFILLYLVHRVHWSKLSGILKNI